MAEDEAELLRLFRLLDAGDRDFLLDTAFELFALAQAKQGRTKLPAGNVVPFPRGSA